MGKVEHRNIEWYEAPDNDPWTIAETISVDCEHWERLHNANAMFGSYLYLNECKHSKESGLYQLILNGNELYYGKLPEINAVVKSMIKLIEEADNFI